MKLLSALFDEINPFPNVFNDIITINETTDLSIGDALILWGGEDIGTLLYDQRPNKHCYRAKPSGRDYLEYKLIREAVKLHMPIIGICRGAQMLSIAAGGKLMQHIDNHSQHHNITLHDEEDTIIRTNSTHHQMMMPPKNAVILASASGTTGVDEHNTHCDITQVPEVVLFPTMRALGIQYHPEWTNCPREAVSYSERKLKEIL